MSTITKKQQKSIADFIRDKHIPRGMGTETEACSIAAINLALTGELTDRIPGCMSLVIGTWIIRVQDAMPDAMRNSAEWRRLLPLAAGTGRDPEQEKARLALIMDWMWIIVLPSLQPIADTHGVGNEWLTMTTQRSQTAAWAAKSAAKSAAAWAAAAAAAAAAAWAAKWAAASAAAEAAAEAATWAAAEAAAAAKAKAAAPADAEWAAAAADAAADAAAAWAADAAKAAAKAAAHPWATFDPCTLLERMVNA